jgi:alpha-mannosidase
VLKAEQNYLDKAVSDRCLMLFGIGDGGGGPGEEHLERLQREADLAGLCPVVQEPASAFFRRIARDGERYGSWVGELYLERHQGTFTTQARTKRFNRKIELGLRELEFVAAVASQFAAAPYPREELEQIWKEVLLYQFHDILPGSSITRVYQEATARYDALTKQVEAMIAAADAALCSRIDRSGAERPVVVVNSLSWERTGWLELASGWIEAKVPALGYAVIDAGLRADFMPPRASASEIENEKLRIVFNTDGSIRSCFDKEHSCSVLAPGAAGNILAVYRDDGDAWDIPTRYRDSPPEKFALESTEAFEQGPRAVLRHIYRFGRSLLQQDIVLFSGSRRVDFVTMVDWHEQGRMLRTSFPVGVVANEATCDIQFGSIRRPTHRNTPADFAKFEICAHKWLDLSDRGFGIALLNDCKYGHYVRDNILDLNLLRSPEYPDPVADRGRHHFTYSLYPHAGDHVAGMVARVGYELNVPLRPLSAGPGSGPLPARGSWLQVDAPNIVIETVKQAEDGRGLIVRLYDSAGASTKTILRCSFEVAEVAMTNLIEGDPEALSFAGSGAVRLEFRPFEIHTVRLLAG